MRKRLWSPDEDEKLQNYVSQHGFGNWSEVAKKTGLQRCGKSCRLRWINYLQPDLKRGKFSAEEKLIIVNLQKVFGNSWSKIAAHLPGRTDSDIKNFWHSHFRKKRPQQLMGSTTNLHGLLPTLSSSIHPSNLSHIALMNSIHLASSSPYATYLNTASMSSSSTTSCLYQHPQISNSGLVSVPPSHTIPTIKTPSSTIVVSHSSSQVSTQLVPSSCSISRRQGNAILDALNQKPTPNVPPLMAEEEVPLYGAASSKEDDERSHEGLAGNDFELIGSLCQHATTWFDNKVHERVPTETRGNMHYLMNANIETLETHMFQSMSKSPSLHAHVPPPPEGLDLVVWSCLNRPSQLENEESLPPPSSHVTLANNMHA
ncbi:hypothetical protein L7F22_028461 [Adiantum nelumboides]|nr:hypothetical protein [Adiantum nelumboides]